MFTNRALALSALIAGMPMAGCSGQSKPNAGSQAMPDESGENPLEEQSETPGQEQAEEATEGTGGTNFTGGAGGSRSDSPGDAPGNASGGALSATGGTSGSTGAPGTGLSGSSGGFSVGVGGAGGTSSSGGAAGSPPVTGGGGAPGTGGSAAGGSATTFPALMASSFGQPTRVAATTSFTLAEGPLWDPCAHRLLFVDVSASKIYSLTTDGQLSVFASNTNFVNGIAFDADGSLVMAQMGRPGHVVRRDKSGQVTVLDPPGAMLHTPDDVIVRSDGVIYFTDGDFPPVGGVDLSPLPVYALLPGTSSLQNGGSVPGPNGIELSPDEKTLYVDAYFQGSVVAYTVMPDGTIMKGTPLTGGLTNPDSLCLDAAGNLYVGVSTGLQVLRPDGSRVGLIPVRSTQGVTNCAFGGDDGKTLYITAWTTVWQITGMPIPGLEWSVNRRRLNCM